MDDWALKEIEWVSKFRMKNRCDQFEEKDRSNRFSNKDLQDQINLGDINDLEDLVKSPIYSEKKTTKDI